jgi:hypothetical protein
MQHRFHKIDYLGMQPADGSPLRSSSFKPSNTTSKMGLGKEEWILLEQLQSNFRKQIIDIDAYGSQHAIWDKSLVYHIPRLA